MPVSIRRLIYWGLFVISSTVAIVNIHVLRRADFALRRETNVSPNSHLAASRMLRNRGRGRRPRTLLGIISADNRNDCAYRKRHRELFSIWDDPRLCSLADYPYRSNCQLIYTFVIGGAENETAPTELVNSSLPILLPTPLASNYPDVNDPDVTLLNIQENMNEGKSPTFLYYASQMMKKYDIDYVMKLDGDSILHLHDWFAFAHQYLPPKGHGILGGALRHKAFWLPDPKLDPNGTALYAREDFWRREYDNVHMYVAGQCYFMSRDLCDKVIQEAPVSAHYTEGHEDHDVSSMVYFDSDRPVHLMAIGKSQRFWEHPVKGQPRWERIRKREIARMQGAPFENKELRLYMDV
mmetsp:Transcript_117452/g.339571  ORF Transcript_117452/g.339571 Transcript_117452/m.339571 type:complete len:352 (+) Transcript_117452:234-1289(+)